MIEEGDVTGAYGGAYGDDGSNDLFSRCLPTAIANATIAGALTVCLLVRARALVCVPCQHSPAAA